MSSKFPACVNECLVLTLQFHFPNVFCFISYYHLQIAREVLDAAARVIKPGITTDEIDRVVHEETIARGEINLL